MPLFNVFVVSARRIALIALLLTLSVAILNSPASANSTAVAQASSSLAAANNNGRVNTSLNNINSKQLDSNAVAVKTARALIDNEAMATLLNDNTAPVGSVINASDGSIVPASRSFTIQGQVTDEDTSVSFVLVQLERIDLEPSQFWNGSDWQASSRATYLLAELDADNWSLPAVNLSNTGTYNVRFSARDRAGNVSPASDNVSTFTVEASNGETEAAADNLVTSIPAIDNTAPRGITINPLNNATLSTNMSFTIEGQVSDDQTGVAFVLAQLERQNGGSSEYWNGLSWQDSTRGTFLLAELNGDSWALPAVNLAQPGVYLVRFSARDRAGNVSPANDNVSTFTVEGQDLTPVTIVSIGQASLDADGNAGPSFIRLDFESLAATEHTITVAWDDDDADIEFTVKQSDGTPLSANIQGTNPGTWTGFLEGDTAYFLTLFSLSGNTSFTASIEAAVPLSITTQPVDVSVIEGDDAFFSVEASGSGNLNFQWFANGLALPGETDSTLRILNTSTAENNTRISVQIDNGAEVISSDVATLTVDARLVAGQYSLAADTSAWMLHGPAPTVDFDATQNTDGWGMTLLRVDDLLLVGGDFSGIKPSINGSVTDRPFLAALDAVSGQPTTTFEIAPEIDDVVRALVLSADGDTLYAGGDFGLLALDATSGELEFIVDVSDENGVGRIYDIAVTNTQLYIGGDFSNINGRFRANIARLSLDGEIDDSWSPNVTNGFSTGRAAPVQALAVSADENTVYIGGNFQQIDDTPVSRTPQNGRISFLAVSSLDGSVQPQRFSPDVDGDTKGLNVNDILVNENYVIIAWGGPNFLSFHLADGSRLRQYESEGDVQQLQIVGDHLFVGHHGEFFGKLPNPIPQQALISADPLIIEPYKFNSFRIDDPSFEAEQAWPVRGAIGIWGVAAAEDAVWIAGNITSAGTNAHQVEGLVKFQANE